MGTDKLIKLKKIGPTRWNSANTALRNIFYSGCNQNEFEHSRNNNYYALETHHTIVCSEETDSYTSIEVRALLIKWTSYETILTAFLFLQLFSTTTPVSKYLQTKELDNITAWNKINHLMTCLRDLSKENNYSLLFSLKL